MPDLPGAGLAEIFDDDMNRYLGHYAEMLSGDNFFGHFFSGPPGRIVHFDDGLDDGNKEVIDLGGGEAALRSIIAQDLAHAQQSVVWEGPWRDGGLPDYSGTLATYHRFRRSAGGTPGTEGCKWMQLIQQGGSNKVQFGLSGNTDARPLWEVVLGANPGDTVNRTQQRVSPFWDQLPATEWHEALYLVRPNTSTSYLWTGGGHTSDDEVYSGTSSHDGLLALAIRPNGGAWSIVLAYHQSLVVPYGTGFPGGEVLACRQGDVDFIPSWKIGGFHFPGVFNGSPVAWTLDHKLLRMWAVP